MDYSLMNVPRQLTTVEFRLEIPTRPGAHMVNTLAQGLSPNKRRPLWTEANVYNSADSDTMVEPADWIHHIALCALQDRPASQRDLIVALTGGMGEQHRLF